MKHAVIGGGNLGLDIMKYGLAHNLGEFELFTSSNGWHYDRHNRLIRAIQDYEPDHIWVTVGAGSVEGAKKDLTSYIDLHLRLPADLLQNMPAKTTLHFFSTNYVFKKHLSLYAQTKAAMEDLVHTANRPNTFVYRVESLYGTHCPEKTFPGKFLARNPKPCTVTLPANLVAPTPTAWLAEVLLLPKSDPHPFHNVAPYGGVPVSEWAKAVVDDSRYEILKGDLDPERPEGISFNEGPPLACTLLPLLEQKTWLHLWLEYYKKEDYDAK